MNKVSIQFGGMANIPDESVAQDGEMAVLINMRHKGGELVNSLPPSSPASLGKVEQMLFHNNSKRWLVLNNEGVIKIYKEDYSADGAISAEGVKSFALLGNIVVINLENDVVYAIWRDNGFEYLGGLPDVPKMRCDISVKTVKTDSTKYYGGIREATTAGYPQLWEGYNRKSELDVCLKGLYDSGAYIDFANFRVALKLFDGTYKAVSPIYLVNGTRKTTTDEDTTGGYDNFRWRSNTNYTSENYYWAEVEGFIPTFKLDEYNFEDWSDIVSSICVFTSGSLPLRGVKKGLPEYMLEALLSNDYEDYIILTAEEFKDSLLYANYYKIAEYDLKGNVINTVKNTSPSNLATQEMLVMRDLKDYIGGNQVNINSRLHTFGMTTLYPQGFADLWTYGSDEEKIDKIAIKTFIKTEHGNVETITESGDCKTLMSALLTYPDRYAHRMDVYVKARTQLLVSGEHKQSNIYYKSFELNKDEFFAYNISDECWKINSIEITSELSYNVEVANANWLIEKYGSGTLECEYKEAENGDKYWAINSGRQVITAFFKISGTPAVGDKFSVKITCSNPQSLYYKTLASLRNNFEKPIDNPDVFKDADLQWGDIEGTSYKTLLDFTVKKSSNAVTVKTSNILKVSAQDNPFYFPNEQTYMFDGEIMGLASNAEAISQGQFGQFPLFVFTKEGIWAMQVDSTGKGAYTTQTPFSREVCNGEVCPVSGGIIFTTDRGVMAISGNQVTEISAPLDGDSPDYISPTSIFKEIYRVGEFSTDNLLVPDNIRTYIKGAKIAYNYLHNEVILSNANKGYSLVYKIDSQRWSMIDYVFDVTTNSYPELVVYNNSYYYNNKKGAVYSFDDKEKKNCCLAITRPFTLGTTGFKRLRQAALRYKGEGYAYFYVLGSNDGRNFVCLTGNEFKGRNKEYITDFNNRDLVTPMSRSRQCKYFAIAVALPNFSGSVSLAELLVDAGLANNKLR